MLLGLLVAGFMTVAAGSAAANQVFVDVLTSNYFHNQHLQSEFEGDGTDLSGWNPIKAKTLDYSYVGGNEGLGSAWVHAGEPKIFEHIFSPSTSVSHVEGAWLTLWLIDDYDDDLVCNGLDCVMEDEFARIRLNDGTSEWTLYEGNGFPGTRSFILGDMIGSIEQAGDTLQVTVSAYEGDFRIKGSGLAVSYYDEAEGAHMPEPSAALLFCIGGLLVARRSGPVA